MSIYSFSPFGYEGSTVTVEIDLRRGIPAVDIVGLADACVSASRARIREAITQSGFDFPQERVLISLSPADLYKEGSMFDLAVALAILAEKEGIKTENVLVMGELTARGDVLPVRAVEAALQTAHEQGIRYAIIPATGNVASIPDGMEVASVTTLKGAYDALKMNGFSKPDNKPSDGGFKVEFEPVDFDNNLDCINGIDGLKYAMAVAVAGRHNILAYGAPGCGKTLTFQHMPELLPKLTKDEIPTVNRIYSLTGLSGMDCVVNHTRPFRMPHQFTTIESMCGGGPRCSPGEITLAHNGVLFLDEAAEFRSSVLQMLRVPVESGQITLSRAGRSTVYPARFQLVMAANPCPCGNYGVKDRLCLCSARSIDQYWKKFGGPLLDRISVRFNMSTQNGMEVSKWSLEALRRMIRIAWERQYKRQGKLNQDLEPTYVLEYCKMSDGARELLDKEELARDLSARALGNIMKLARTIADMHDTANDLFPEEETDSRIQARDMATALQLFGATPV